MFRHIHVLLLLLLRSPARIRRNPSRYDRFSIKADNTQEKAAVHIGGLIDFLTQILRLMVWHKRPGLAYLTGELPRWNNDPDTAYDEMSDTYHSLAMADLVC